MIIDLKSEKTFEELYKPGKTVRMLATWNAFGDVYLWPWVILHWIVERSMEWAPEYLPIPPDERDIDNNHDQRP